MVILVIAFGVAVLVSVIHHYQLRFAVDNYLAELKAKGEPMELAQVIPPPVPPEQNGAPFFLKAAALLTTNQDILFSNLPTAMRAVALGKASVGWQQPEIRDEFATNSWAELETALEQNDVALKQLVQITNFPAYDFGLKYDQRVGMLLSHLAVEKKGAQKLSASAMNDLRLGAADLAVQKVRAILVLANGTQDERTAISQLVRIAITQIAFATVWELLQSTNLSDERLVDLQAACAKLEFNQAEEFAFCVEREGDLTMTANWRSSNAEFQHYFDLIKKVQATLGDPDGENSFADCVKLKAKIFLWRYWWSYPDELRYLKGAQVLIGTLRQARTNGFFQSALSAQDAELKRLEIANLKSGFDTIFTGQIDFHTMQSESVVTLVGVIRKVMRVEVAKQVAVTAIALKRYQLKHGNYPPDLNSLAPEFVSAVPLDPVDGQPLRYRRNTDGTFLLYSVGENGVDDGGDPFLKKSATSSSFNWQNQHALDWVWPQPATEAEVKYFYEHPPK